MLVNLFCLLLYLHPFQIEIFCDYASDAKGDDRFPLVEEQSLEALLQTKVHEQGGHVVSWELAKYRPWLLSWNKIQSFEDLRHFFGLDLPRKNPISETTKYWMFWNLGPLLSGAPFSKFPKEKLALMMWEPPTVQPMLYDPEVQKNFGKIFTWDDDLVREKGFLKFHYPVLQPMRKDCPPFEEKKFCVMISRKLGSKHAKELYSQRMEMIKFFETKSKEEFDLFGAGWKQKKRSSYRGYIPDKLAKLKEYKFSICYENMRDVSGYITEKIFDCFAAGVVPIYWGASNITDYIPKNCFIDRREFASNEELYQVLKKMSKEEYEEKIQNIQRYLLSEEAKVFSKEYFTQNLLSHLELYECQP